MDEKLAILEAILFVTGAEGISLKTMMKILCSKKEEVKFLLKIFQSQLNEGKQRGLVLKQFGEKYKLLTKPNLHQYLILLTKVKTQKLSASSLETLAIISYKSPITKVEINEIRGIESSFTIKKLIAHDLVKEQGKSELPGKPILYGVSDFFFDYFDLTDLSHLPKLADINESGLENSDLFTRNREI